MIGVDKAWLQNLVVANQVSPVNCKIKSSRIKIGLQVDALKKIYFESVMGTSIAQKIIQLFWQVFVMGIRHKLGGERKGKDSRGGQGLFWNRKQALHYLGCSWAQKLCTKHDWWGIASRFGCIGKFSHTYIYKIMMLILLVALNIDTCSNTHFWWLRCTMWNYF